MTAGQLSLLASEKSPHQASSDTARLILFNAQHASPERARRQVTWLAGQEAADLVVITEVGSGPGGEALVNALGDHGYTSVVDPLPDTRDFRTVLASRSAPLTPVESGVRVLPHRAPCATVCLGSQLVTLLGLYVPSRGPAERRNQAKRAFQAAVSATLPGLVARCPGPFIVAGDLNVVEPGHTPHHRVFGEWEYDFYRSFASVGLTDAFRHLQADLVDHSWYGRAGNGYRFDHIFLSAAHTSRLLLCEYLHEPRLGGLTDHSAMVMQTAFPESGSAT